MVVRVHGRTTVLRADTEPAAAACLTERDVLMLEVADLADGGAALDMNFAKLTRRHTEECIFAFLSHELSGRASAAYQLGTLADLQLDVVYRSTNRDILQGQGVADLDISIGAGNDRCANLQAIRSQDVALLAVCIVEQSDARAAVRIVLDRRDAGGDAFTTSFCLLASRSSRVSPIQKITLRPFFSASCTFSFRISGVSLM